MLSRLQVDNFALIERVEMDFGPGLNVITGETGAGKSILIGALNCILGGPARAELVRGGADACSVEGLFVVAPSSPAMAALAEMEIPLEDDQVVLRREIRRGGRSRAFINGRLITVRQLRELGLRLVDLHGQHEHQSLLDTDLHARFLDECGGLTREAAEVGQAFGLYRGLLEESAGLRQTRQSLMDEEELRQYQLEEIRRLAPQPGEDVALEREVLVLENLAELVQSSHQVYDSLYGAEDSTVARLGRARRELERLAELDATLLARVEALSDVLYRVEDLSEALRDYAEGMEADPVRLEEAQLRLEEIRRLKQKHGGTLEEVLARARLLSSSEERTADLDREIVDAEKRCKAALDRFAAACRQLSSGREQAAGHLVRQVEGGLKALGMAGASFRVEMRRCEDADGPVEDGGHRYRAEVGGMEQVEFYISANPGERPLPLAAVASGGEISRIMLVLKSIIAERDTVATLVFDEIDVGISGRVAAAVGNRLGELSATHQTIIITHLPQIASRADHHFSVRKRRHQGRTITEVCELGKEGRAEELAQLLAGETVSAAARRHAEEMLG
ncbi:DNA repair protein RecN [Candidatus Latescibacterota bacterium]